MLDIHKKFSSMTLGHITDKQTGRVRSAAHWRPRWPEFSAGPWPTGHLRASKDILFCVWVSRIQTSLKSTSPLDLVSSPVLEAKTSRCKCFPNHVLVGGSENYMASCLWLKTRGSVPLALSSRSSPLNSAFQSLCSKRTQLDGHHWSLHMATFMKS